MPPHLNPKQGKTNPLIWTLAIACAILAIAVIVTGIAIFAVYMIYQPKMPYIKVAYAHLNDLVYDQTGLLEVDMTLDLLAENENNKAHAGFSDLSFFLQFHGIGFAELQADLLDVPRNSSTPLKYLVRSSPIPLDRERMEAMDNALRRGVVPFDLGGHARTQWRVGIFLSVKFWTHLSCRLLFFWPNGSAVDQPCSSTGH